MSRLTEKSKAKNMYRLIIRDETMLEMYEAISKKLGQLEDVLENFGIESAEELRRFLNFKENMAIWDSKATLENEIKDLKERLSKAIVPKFEIGQEVWVKDWTGQLRTGRIYEVATNSVLHDKQTRFTYLVDFLGYYSDDEQENDYYEEKDIYSTKTEAEQKLKELEGK